MAFIHKIVGEDEKLIGIARLHWIYAAKGLVWLIGLTLIGGVSKFYLGGLLGGGLAPIGNALFWIGLLFGAVMFLFYFVMLISTELGLTTQRAIYKRGLIFVDVREVDLEEVKSASVDHGLLGSILNYGFIMLDARFIDDIGLPAINDPYRYLKAMNEVREKIKEDSMHVILDQQGQGAIKTKDDMNNDDEGEEKSPRLRNKAERSLDDPRYEGLSDSPEENMGTLMEDEEKPQPKPKSKYKSKSKPQKESQDTKSDDPLQKTVKQHLEEKIIDDFEEAEEIEGKSK